MTLGERSGSRDNCFNFLRLAAAAAVVFSHSFALAGAGWEPIAARTGQTGGALAVYVFFALSGFLIAKSWCERPDLGDYLLRRALRILPGMAACTLFAVAVVGPLATTLPWGEYFGHPATKAYLGNVWLYPLHYMLPGVFAANPVAHAANGSLWSLPVEALMYFAVPAAWGLGFCLGEKRKAGLAFAALALAAFDWRIASRPENAAWVVLNFLVPSSVQCAEYFLAGALLYAFRDRVPLRNAAAAMAAAGLAASAATPVMPIVWLACLPYLALWTAYRFPGLGRPCQRHDLSYGLYVYAFPIQQLWMHWFPQLHWAGLFALSLPPTLGLAWLSWRWIEKPCLAFARRRNAPAPALTVRRAA